MSTKQKKTERISAFLSLGIKQGKFLLILTRAAHEHKLMEKYFFQLVAKMIPGEEFREPEKCSMAKYFQKNFFSILFVSMFISAGISPVRRKSYGIILHCLRAIVTAADNIIDNEDKGAIFLDAGIKSRVLNNFLLTMVAQQIISEQVRIVSGSPGTAAKIQQDILSCLCSIARGEDISCYQPGQPPMSPQLIIGEIHSAIGSRLLTLALVAPLVNESGATLAVMKEFEQGILNIGLALQMLDDCTDWRQDLLDNKNNLLVSTILYDGRDGYVNIEKLLEFANEKKSTLEKDYHVSRKYIVDQAIKTAIDGFAKLSDGGYPIDKTETIALLKAMFTLRGMAGDFSASSYS